jgi:hypothetical protein
MERAQEAGFREHLHERAAPAAQYAGPEARERAAAVGCAERDHGSDATPLVPGLEELRRDEAPWRSRRDQDSSGPRSAKRSMAEFARSARPGCSRGRARAGRARRGGRASARYCSRARSWRLQPAQPWSKTTWWRCRGPASERAAAVRGALPGSSLRVPDSRHLGPWQFKGVPRGAGARNAGVPRPRVEESSLARSLRILASGGGPHDARDLRPSRLPLRGGDAFGRYCSEACQRRGPAGLPTGSVPLRPSGLRLTARAAVAWNVLREGQENTMAGSHRRQRRSSPWPSARPFRWPSQEPPAKGGAPPTERSPRTSRAASRATPGSGRWTSRSRRATAW